MKRMTVQVVALATIFFCFLELPSWAISSIAPVTVTADTVEDDQERSPGTITVVHPEKLRGEMKSLPDLLRQVAGVHVIETGGHGGYTVASVRGSTAAQVAVYVDGVLANLGGDAAMDLSTIPLDRIERIEVYRGYVPAAFDISGMGAVINVVTKRMDDGQGSLLAGAGQYGYYRGALRYGTSLGEGNLSIALQGEGSDGDFPYRNDNASVYNLDDDYDTRRLNNGFSSKDGMIAWSDDNWKMVTTWGKRKRELPLPAPGNDKPGQVPGPWQDTTRWSFNVGRNQSMENLDWSWYLGYLGEDKDYFDPGDDLGSWGSRYNRYETRRKEAGLSCYKTLGDHLLELNLKVMNEELGVAGDVVSSLGGRDSFDRDSYSAVLQDSWAAKSWTISPLIRWNSVDDESGTSWALALERPIGDDWYFKGTAGYSMRAPNFYEKYGDGATIVPNNSLEWEEGFHWDLGVRWNGWIGEGEVSSGITLFGMNMNNMIEYIQINQRVGKYENVGKADIKGVELEGSIDWEKWSLSMACTFMDGENRTEGYRYGKKLPNRPKSALDIRLTHAFRENLSGYLEMNYQGETFFDMSETVGYTDLTRFNLGFRWAIHKDQVFTFGVDDVFDKGPDVRQFATGGAGGERLPWYPLQGRTWHVSYIWSF